MCPRYLLLVFQVVESVMEEKHESVNKTGNHWQSWISNPLNSIQDKDII